MPSGSCSSERSGRGCSEEFGIKSDRKGKEMNDEKRQSHWKGRSLSGQQRNWWRFGVLSPEPFSSGSTNRQAMTGMRRKCLGIATLKRCGSDIAMMI